MIAIDIQRGFHKNHQRLPDYNLSLTTGRDHGLPTYLNARRQCGLSADFASFDDLLSIFSQTNVNLMEEIYESVEDIDLYVGGTLESFASLDQFIFGETFRCIIISQYKHSMAADVYFYSHESNPYPFTPAQIDIIESFTFQNLMCQNSNIEFVPSTWFQVESSTNQFISCENYQPINLTAWKA